MSWHLIFGPGPPVEVQDLFNKWICDLPQEFRDERNFRIDRMCAEGEAQLRVLVVDGALPDSILRDVRGGAMVMDE